VGGAQKKTQHSKKNPGNSAGAAKNKKKGGEPLGKPVSETMPGFFKSKGGWVPGVALKFKEGGFTCCRKS